LWAEINATPLRDADGTITGYHGITREITDRKRSQEQIYQLAFYDALTTLPNRRLLLDRFRQALVQAKRFQRSLAIMYLDIDNFKRVNDSLGHDIGDELLKIVAGRLQACVRIMDTVCRQGGDEFIVVLSEITHPRDAAVVADKIIKAINKPVSLQGHDLCITISIGIAIYPVNGTDDARELMKKADIAMYEVKNKDKNGYALYQSPCY
jgi:diguanylate cyclase (GGDEF)-like protein